MVGPVLKSYLPSVKVDEWICGAGATSCSSSSSVARSNFQIDQGSLDSRSGVTGHDTTGFGAGYAVRGNVTGLRRWNAQDGVWITQSLKYDIAGNVTLATDPNSNDTTISYTDDFTSGNPPSGSTFAFPTTIVRDAGGFNHTTTFRYDYNLGRQTEMFDENNTETTFAYADNLDRPLRSWRLPAPAIHRLPRSPTSTRHSAARSPPRSSRNRAARRQEAVKKSTCRRIQCGKQGT